MTQTRKSMKKALLLITTLSLNLQAMNFPSESAQERWQQLIAHNPESKARIDEFLKQEVAKYHPGFDNWQWKPRNSPHGTASAAPQERTIYLPYIDLLLINDYLEGIIPKQAILSVLATLHHEITHIVQKHASPSHPLIKAYEAYDKSFNPDVTPQERDVARDRFLHEGLYSEWLADYGIPNVPNILHAASGFFKSLPTPPETSLVNIHPHHLARAAATEDRYAKLKVGKQISQGLRFAHDKLPKIEGTSPIKAAKVLGIEDPYYYLSLSQDEHPFDVTLRLADKQITMPYHVAAFSALIENIIKNKPQSGATYVIQADNIIDPSIPLDIQDLVVLKDLLIFIEKSFYQGMMTPEVTTALTFFIAQNGPYFSAHIAALGKLFNIPLIDQAITLYYKNMPQDALIQAIETYQHIIMQNLGLFKQGAQHILQIIHKLHSTTLLYK